MRDWIQILPNVNLGVFFLMSKMEILSPLSLIKEEGDGRSEVERTSLSVSEPPTTAEATPTREAENDTLDTYALCTLNF